MKLGLIEYGENDKGRVDFIATTTTIEDTREIKELKTEIIKPIEIKMDREMREWYDKGRADFDFTTTTTTKTTTIEDTRELKELKTEIATEPETEYDKFRKNHIKEEDEQEDSEDNKK
jgi:hypothetical protein